MRHKVIQTKSILDAQFGFDYITLSDLKTKVQDPDSICIIALDKQEVLGISIAVMGKAKIHGLITDKRDHISSDGSMTPRETTSEDMAKAVAFILAKGVKK